MTIACHTKGQHLGPSLKKQKEPELAMVKFTNTSSNPETMVVKFPHTLVAFFTVSASVGLLKVANIAETFGW